MDTPDLRLAKCRLHRSNLNLVIVKKERVIFETKTHGLSGFLLALKKLGKQLVGAAIADRIVGKAAALLCAYSQVDSVFAVTLSKEGGLILRKSSILYEYKNLVPNILNNDGTDVCPFEKLVAGLMNPKEAYLKLKQKVSSPTPKTPKGSQKNRFAP